ncbi:MAG: hypothetical protein M0Q46_06180 [Endomicrobiales bacterium]|nr:hypothetical protein [Endomicrobiales bacterium]
MPSTTGNARTFAKVLQNGEGNIPDATEVMANFDRVNDMFFICTEAELGALTPDTKTLYLITDCDDSIMLRVYRSGVWKAIPLMDIE